MSGLIIPSREKASPYFCWVSAVSLLLYSFSLVEAKQSFCFLAVTVECEGDQWVGSGPTHSGSAWWGSFWAGSLSSLVWTDWDQLYWQVISGPKLASSSPKSGTEQSQFVGPISWVKTGCEPNQYRYGFGLVPAPASGRWPVATLFERERVLKMPHLYFLTVNLV